LLTPLSGTGYFLGVVLAHLAIAGGQTFIVYGIAYGFGGAQTGRSRPCLSRGGRR